jgi:hypothetical protein
LGRFGSSGVVRLVELERADPEGLVAEIVTVVDVEGHADAVVQASASRRSSRASMVSVISKE